MIPAGSGGGPGGARPADLLARTVRMLDGLFERDAVVLAGLLLLAGIARLAGLEARGRFDGDQGHDALVLLRFVRDGVWPLLGPPTSIGDFHHGAAYYYLLAPAAWLSGADPTAIVAWIAAIGVAAVGAMWWFARSVGGRVPAAIAGILMAVSPAAIEESTFIWNPNPIPLFAALALGCAWRAHSTGGTRWWTPAVVAAGMVLQLHVLGIVFLPPILALAVADAVRAVRSGSSARVRAIGRAVGAGLGLAALLFVPLLIYELRSGFDETRRLLDFLAAGGAGESRLDPIATMVFILFRSVGWPLVGLVTDAPVGAIVVVSVTIVLSGWLMLRGRGVDGDAARWLGLTVLWSAGALTILAPSLAVVVAGLPNDHYHAFLDPVVFVLLALAARAISRGTGAVRLDAGRWGADITARGDASRGDAAARALVLIALGTLILLEIRLWPPADPYGGWPAARDAGVRIVAAASGGQIDIRGLPIFKTSEGIGFPVIVAGGDAVVATDRASAVRPVVPGATLVIACDRLFEAVIGDPCGGPAEAGYVARLMNATSPPPTVERFDLSPRISISIFRP